MYNKEELVSRQNDTGDYNATMKKEMKKKGYR